MVHVRNGNVFAEAVLSNLATAVKHPSILELALRPATFGVTLGQVWSTLQPKCVKC
jgi:hypothetical protein